LTPSADTQFKGATHQWGAKYMGVGKIVIFGEYLRLSRKRYEIGPWLLWNVNRKSDGDSVGSDDLE